MLVDPGATTLPEQVPVRWFGTTTPRALDYATRRIAGLARGVPSHVLYVERPRLRKALQDVARDADLVYLAGWGTAGLASVVSPTPVVHFAVDPWAASVENRRLPRWRRLADLGERRHVIRHEAQCYPLARAVVVVAESDAESLRRDLPGTHVVVVPNGVDLGVDPAAFPATPTIGFHGAFETQANVDGATALVREVLPLVRAQVPSVRALLVGRQPPPEIVALAGPEVELRADVPSVRAELDRMSVHVTWMPSGMGMKNKVLEAMAAGRPVVANARGASGIGAGDGLLVAPEPRDAASRIAALLTDPTALAQAGAAARARVVRDFTWSASAAALERVWLEAVS